MDICESLLYRSEKSDFYIPVHTTKFWLEVKIHLDAASPGEAVYVPATAESNPASSSIGGCKR